MTKERHGREHPAKEPEVVPPPPGSIADTFREVLPQTEFLAAQGVLDVILTVRREDLPAVMQAAKEDSRLAFDYLRCVCGVDQQEAGLELVYHLYSFSHGHNVTVKTVLSSDGPRVATMTHLWKAANWLERETAEMFGINFEGHPDLRPLLLEEGLGYHPLLKSHPLAEIEEWQEELIRVEEAPASAEGEESQE